jgi:hypothetical protein
MAVGGQLHAPADITLGKTCYPSCMDREPQIEDCCSVVKPIGTTVKMASKKLVETKKIVCVLVKC